MSYAFDMCFRQCSSINSALSLANKYVQSLSIDDCRDILKDNCCYLPANRFGFAYSNEKYKNVLTTANQESMCRMNTQEESRKLELYACSLCDYIK